MENQNKINDMATKKQREIVYNKFGGHCAYCGCQLKKGWHIDHAEPVERKYERKGGGMFKAGTNERLTHQDFEGENIPNYEYRQAKLVQNGFHKPENDHINNWMPSCPSCNINKHSLNIDGFRRFVGNFIKSLNKSSTQYKVAKRYGLVEETGIEISFFFERWQRKQKKSK